MSWKKSVFYFAWQSLRTLPDTQRFSKSWQYYPAWRASLQPGRSTMADEQAWLNFPAIEFLDAYLKPEHKVFEFGGGGSTLFFCKRAGMVVTVENDETWFAALTQSIQKKGYTHWSGDYQDGEPRTDGLSDLDPANPAHFSSNGKGWGHLSYERYAKMIHQHPDAYFDLVLVDGRSRPSCIMESYKHLKTNGILVVDNMERAYYWEVLNNQLKGCFEVVAGALAPTPYHPDFTQTMIFKKVK